MTRGWPAEGWKRSARLATLFAAGALGIFSRLHEVPRLVILLAAVAVPLVWMVTSFEARKAGETEAERHRRMRNLAIGLALFAVVALFYAATMVRMGGNVLNRPL